MAAIGCHFYFLGRFLGLEREPGTWTSNNQQVILHNFSAFVSSLEATLTKNGGDGTLPGGTGRAHPRQNRPEAFLTLFLSSQRLQS